MPSRKSKKFDVLERAQLTSWFAAVRGLSNPVVSAYLQGLLLTGARREELAPLRWDDVDFKWNSLWVKDKMAAEGRKIPLTPYFSSLLHGLKRINETRPKVKDMAGNTIDAPDWKPSPWVFFSKSAAAGRLLAQTTIVKRTVISLEAPGLVASDPDQPAETGAPEELSEMDIFYRGFWQDLVGTMKFDDPAQPVPKPNRVGNIFLAMPSGANAWITLYFLQQRREIGAFLTFSRGSQGDAIYQYLLDDKDAIEKELDLSIEWDSADGKHKIVTSKTFDDLRSSTNRGSILSWFADVSNKYVNAFRPRIQRYLAAE